MSHNQSLGLLAAVGLAGLVLASCGSSNGAAADAGSEISHKGPGAIVADSSAGDAGDDGGTVAADGTSGHLCTTDADCQPDGGPGINKCTNGSAFQFTYSGVKVTTLPTPVCKVPPTVACDPQPASDPSGNLIHFCDGPDDSKSPGICIPSSVPHSGTCEVSCQFAPDGSAPAGCKGKNTCTPYTFVTFTDGTTTGFGFCQGSCQQDSDCAGLGAGWLCQVDVGLCTQRTKVRTKPIGAACSQSARVNDLTTGACNCQVVSQTTGNGFCTSNCVVGGNPVCPSGWVCDNGEFPLQLPDGSVLSMENVQTAGVCVQACSMDDGGAPAVMDAGAASDASGDALSGDGSAVVPDAGASAPPTTCPPNSTCQQMTALPGSECWP